MDPPRDGGSETIRSGWFTPLTGCHNVTPHPEAVVGLLLTSQLPPLIIVGSGTAVVRNVSIGYEAGSRTWWISLLFANVDSVAEKNGFWFSSEPLITGAGVLWGRFGEWTDGVRQMDMRQTSTDLSGGRQLPTPGLAGLILQADSCICFFLESNVDFSSSPWPSSL